MPAGCIVVKSHVLDISRAKNGPVMVAARTIRPSVKVRRQIACVRLVPLLRNMLASSLLDRARNPNITNRKYRIIAKTSATNIISGTLDHNKSCWNVANNPVPLLFSSNVKSNDRGIFLFIPMNTISLQIGIKTVFSMEVSAWKRWWFPLLN